MGSKKKTPAVAPTETAAPSATEAQAPAAVTESSATPPVETASAPAATEAQAPDAPTVAPTSGVPAVPLPAGEKVTVTLRGNISGSAQIDKGAKLRVAAEQIAAKANVGVNTLVYRDDKGVDASLERVIDADVAFDTAAKTKRG